MVTWSDARPPPTGERQKPETRNQKPETAGAEGAG
jgi:hypothetical protein